MNRVKSLLIFSLFLNVILAAIAAVVLSRNSSRPPLPPEPRPVAIAVAPAATALSDTQPAPFRWSQVESSDDATYIGNLRALRCPETTILDLLSTAIGHRYDATRQTLKDQQAKGEIDAASYEEAVTKAWEEQNDLLAKLFGRPGSYGSGGMISKAVLAAQEPVSSSTNRAPVVFMEPDPSWGLSSQDLAIWEQVNAQFVDAIGGPGQNPKDPAYHQRWKEAETIADERLKLLLGDETYTKFEMQVPGYMSATAGH